MVNQIISATRYNQLQGRIAALLGAGSGDKGYDQSVDSSPVPVGDTVLVTHMNNLYNDFRDVYVHIYGILPTTISTVTSANEITEVLHAEYETLINTLETNRFTVDADYADLEAAGVNSSRASASLWGGDGDPQYLEHEFTITFASANARRGFFNAGGEIRFSATLTPGTSSPSDPNYAKSTNWQAMLSAMGTISFKHSSTTTTGSGTGTSIGNLGLTSTYQTIFTKTGSSSYSDNQYFIQARADNASVIRVKITFQDAVPGGLGVDERVHGDLSSTVNQYRSTGSYVASPSPVYVKVSDIN